MNIPNVGCCFTAATRLGRVPVGIWLRNCLKKLFIIYQLHISNLTASLFKFGTNSAFLYSLPCLYVLFIHLFVLFAWIINYMPLYIV